MIDTHPSFATSDSESERIVCRRRAMPFTAQYSVSDWFEDGTPSCQENLAQGYGEYIFLQQ
jgi:hypothetical protein